MKRSTLFTTIAATLFASAAMAQSTNHADESFLKDFAKANAAEVDAGKLAQERAQNPDVKAFGKHMADDHAKTLAKVTEVAGKSNVNVKEEPGVVDKGKEMLLEHHGTGKFDEAYLKAQVDGHEDVLKMLQKEIDEGQNPNVKQLAATAKPVVQRHLDMAKQLQTKVNGG
jgi:putative membrane protein